MNITEKLMAKAKQSLKRERKTKVVRSQSLSDLLGDECEIRIAAIDDNLFFELSEKLNDEDVIYTQKDFARDVVLDSVLEPNFRKEEIYSRFAGCLTPEDAIAAAFNAQELMSLCGDIVQMSEMGEVDKAEVNAVKN